MRSWKVSLQEFVVRNNKKGAIMRYTTALICAFFFFNFQAKSNEFISPNQIDLYRCTSGAGFTVESTSPSGCFDPTLAKISAANETYSYLSHSPQVPDFLLDIGSQIAIGVTFAVEGSIYNTSSTIVIAKYGESLGCTKPEYPQYRDDKCYKNSNNCPEISGADVGHISIHSTLSNGASLCYENPNGGGQCAYTVNNSILNTPSALASSEPVDCATLDPVVEDNVPTTDCFSTLNGSYCIEDPNDVCSIVTDSLGNTYQSCKENCGYVNNQFMCVGTPDNPLDADPNDLPKSCLDVNFAINNPELCQVSHDLDKNEDGVIDSQDDSYNFNQQNIQLNDLTNLTKEGVLAQQTTNNILNETNKILAEIDQSNTILNETILNDENEESTEETQEDYEVLAERKQGGFESLLTQESIDEVNLNIENLKTEFFNYKAQIESEFSQFTTFNVTGGGYQKHETVLKGATVDLGISKFAQLFKDMAPILLFVATVIAFYILLGGRSD
jgi:hypothetical protein